MYTVGFASGEHETFGCITCGRTFVSKRAIERHFTRNPSHGDVTITGSESGDGRAGSNDDDVRRGVARRRLIERLARDTTESSPEIENDASVACTRNTDASGKKSDESGESGENSERSE